jgi:lipoprotein-anchoring transpeptidase ErfK/SrfK
VGLALVAAVLSSCTTASHATTGSAAHPSTPSPAAASLVALASDGTAVPAPGGVATVNWRQPFRLMVAGGELQSVQVASVDGPVAGVAGAHGWKATSAVTPSSTYRVSAVLRGSLGVERHTSLSVRTSAPDEVLSATVSPDGQVRGVGQPVVVQLNHAVDSRAARAALLARMQVQAVPPAQGDWRFISSTELHYRPAVYWRPGTHVHVRVALRGYRVGNTGTWGDQRSRTTDFTVGPGVVSTVDVTAHTMTVRRNGSVLRVLPVSTGRDKYPTKGGVHLILTVEREQLYDSSTVGIPTASPDGYYEKLPYSMRISDGGAFVHANPATIRFQGRQNVSHGCVNLSLADAQWFYNLSHRGDIVNIVHAAVGPVLSDPGMADWNVSWPTWKATRLG